MIMNLLNYFKNIYLTSFPYKFYYYANSRGNFAMAGVGLGLMYCQKIFWIANGILFIYFLNKSEKSILINNIILYISGGLYSFSFYKCYSLKKYIE